MSTGRLVNIRDASTIFHPTLGSYTELFQGFIGKFLGFSEIFLAPASSPEACLAIPRLWYASASYIALSLFRLHFYSGQPQRVAPTSAVDDCNVDSRFRGNDEMKKRKIYSKEFKLEALQQWEQGGSSAKQGRRNNHPV